ncbi:RAP, partial [Symbiodinium pilosum]
DMESIAAAATPKIQEFDAQGLSNLCWALGCSKVAHRSLYKEVGPMVVSRGCRSYSAQQVANICWSYASVALLHRPLFEDAARFATLSPGDFRAEEISALVWSMAMLGLPSAGLVSSAKALVGASAREAANLAWAAAVMGEHHEDLLSEAAKLLEAEGEAAQDLHLGQWYLAYLAYAQEAKSSGGAAFSEPWLHRSRKAATRRATTQRAGSSRLHSSVSEEVRRVCGPNELVIDELLVEQCIAVDIALPKLRLVIEVDGPVHFACDVESEVLSLLGPSQLKRRLLSRLGWQVLSVDWRDWDVLDRPGRRRLLEHLLQR